MQLLPVSKDKIRKVSIIVCSHLQSVAQDLSVMKNAFEERGAETTIYTLPLDPTYQSDRLILKKIEDECDLLIYASYVEMHRPLGMPSLSEHQAAIFTKAFGNAQEKTIGVSLGYPYLHYDMMAGAPAFVNLYSPAPAGMVAFVKAVYGEIPFEGKSPVDIEPKIRQIRC